MKRISPEERPRFRANIRHYHRTGSPQETGWQQWVDGSSSPYAPKKSKRLRMLVVVGVLVLLGVVTAGVFGLKLG